MPRATPPQLIEQIRTLASDGCSQVEIAVRLGIKQPRVSKIMRMHGIGRTRRGEVTQIRYGTTVYHTPAGDVAIHVTVTHGGKPFQTFTNVSPTQLQQLTDYASSLAF